MTISSLIQLFLSQMAFLARNRKLLLAAGLVGCGTASALLYGRFKSESYVFKARAANVFENNFKDHSNTGTIMASPKWDYNWDRMEPHSSVKPIEGKDDKKEKAKPTATRHLILVRHGQFTVNGEPDSMHTLTALGKEQANYAGLRLKELALPHNNITHSTMTRATETAQIIIKHLPNVSVTSCDLLREGYPIRHEPHEPNFGDYESEKRVFRDGSRFEAAFRNYFHRAEPSQKEDSYDVLVCHANVIRYFVCRALQFPPEAWLRITLHNCCITWIAIEPNGLVYLYSVGDIGHIPPHKLSKT